MGKRGEKLERVKEAKLHNKEDRPRGCSKPSIITLTEAIAQFNWFHFGKRPRTRWIEAQTRASFVSDKSMFSAQKDPTDDTSEQILEENVTASFSRPD